MPSRLRFLIRTRDSILTGARARSVMRLVKTKSLGSDWARIDAEARASGLWRNLTVFRERRGLKNSASIYHSESGRFAVPPLSERRRSRPARWVAPSRLTRLAEPNDPRPRTARPGIFA
jgi:hypothetical protein